MLDQPTMHGRFFPQQIRAVPCSFDTPSQAESGSSDRIMLFSTSSTCKSSFSALP
jgi:hypothetical protein